MSRDFGLVKSSLWGSSRFRRLASDSARLAYVYLHANEHGSAIGCYRLPIQYVAADLSCETVAASAIMDDLKEVGLIDYDSAEQVVRIRKWFDHNPITNPKHLTGAVRSFLRLPSLTEFLPSLAADIIASAWVQARALHDAGVERKRSSNVKSREFGDKNLESFAQMVEQMTTLRDQLFRSDRAPFVKAISELPETLSIALSEGLSIPLSIHERHETRDTNSNSNSDKRHRQETHSPTDTGKPRESVESIIEGLTAKARAQ